MALRCASGTAHVTIRGAHFVPRCLWYTLATIRVCRIHFQYELECLFIVIARVIHLGSVNRMFCLNLN
jgi:hypothetical protein